jgi:prophage maintenance system killer protein
MILIPSIQEVYDFHEYIVENSDADAGIRRRNPDKWIQQVLDEAGDHAEPYLAGAHVMIRMPGLHVFEDANKRTSITVMGRILDLNDRTKVPGDSALYPVVKHYKRYNKYELARWLQTGEIDESRLREKYRSDDWVQ